MISLIALEARVALGDELEPFAERVKARVRVDLRAKAVPVWLIWFILRFVLWYLIEKWFFSQEADIVREWHRADG